MPPKQKGKLAAKKGVKDAPVTLDDKDLLRRAEIEIACLQGLLEVKSQEVGLSPRSVRDPRALLDTLRLSRAESDCSSARATMARASGSFASQPGKSATGSAGHNLEYAEAIQGIRA